MVARRVGRLKPMHPQREVRFWSFEGHVAVVRHRNVGMRLPAKLRGRFTERSNKCLPRTLARKHVMSMNTFAVL